MKNHTNPLYSEDKKYTSEKAKDDLLFDNSLKEYGGLVKLTDTRTVYQHDCDSILYSRSFRRLMHKTQVTYPGAYKDEHTRTRLTHTLEVVRIARALAAAVGLNEDLAEAIALGHDLGHTPFGHEGEEFLDMVCQGNENYGNKNLSIIEEFNLPNFEFDFKHNYQSVRVLLTWEGHHFDKATGKSVSGLNISKQTLEGILKHSKIRRKHGDRKGELYQYPDLMKLNKDFLMLDVDYPVWSVEGQIVAIADEIAQVCHDLEDAVSADYSVKHHLYRELTDFFNNSANAEYYDTLVDQWFMKIKEDTNEAGMKKITVDKNEFHAFISWTIGYLILVVQEGINRNMQNYLALKQKYNQDLFPLDTEIVSEDILTSNKYYSFLKRIEDTYTINNVRINRENGKADFILKSLIEAYLNKPNQLPDSVLERYSSDNTINENIKAKIYSLSWGDDKPNIRYILGKAKTEEALEFLNQLRHDQVFLRYLWDYLASMTDQFALNEYKMLYLGDAAYQSKN